MSTSDRSGAGGHAAPAEPMTDDVRVGDRVRVLPPSFESPVYDGQVRAVYRDPDGVSALVRADGGVLDDLVADVCLVLLTDQDAADRERVVRQARLCARWDVKYGRNRLASGVDAQELYVQYRRRASQYAHVLPVLARLAAAWLVTTEEVDGMDITVTDVHRFFEEAAHLLEV